MAGAGDPDPATIRPFERFDAWKAAQRKAVNDQQWLATLEKAGAGQAHWGHRQALELTVGNFPTEADPFALCMVS